MKNLFCDSCNLLIDKAVSHFGLTTSGISPGKFRKVSAVLKCSTCPSNTNVKTTTGCKECGGSMKNQIFCFACIYEHMMHAHT